MTSGAPRAEAPASTESEALYRDLAAAHLYPLWKLGRDLLPDHPVPRAVPWVWRARTLYPLAERAIEAVPLDRGGERRVLSLGNPGLGGEPYAAGTLWGGLQCLGPGETAPAHRHTPGAIRFVLRGTGVWTTVNGDPCDMSPGDLVLTPSWSWHDHTNSGDGNMIWFDGLDLPMIAALDALFYEPYPEFAQPADGPHNRSARVLRATGARYADGAATRLSPESSPLLVYRWAQTDAELTRIARDAGQTQVTVEFVNPLTGASALPTLSCRMHRLIPGPGPSRTDNSKKRADRVELGALGPRQDDNSKKRAGRVGPVRRTGNAIFVAFRGSGRSVVGGLGFDWSEGDIFVVPSWTAAEHRSERGADLFELADTPVLRALGIYREQTLAEPQAITGELT